MIRRVLCWLQRHDHSQVYVRLRFTDGGHRLLGPMDRYAAEVFMAYRLAPHPFWESRSVASALIHGDTSHG